MFMQLARWFQAQGQTTGQDPQASAVRVFDLHPHQLWRFLEEAWSARLPTLPAANAHQQLPPELAAQELTSGIENQLPAVTVDIYPIGAPGGVRMPWPHLIYAYMIEQTRAFDIFRRVLLEFLHGEHLNVPTDAGQRWLRATEALFFSDPPAGHIARVTSSVRPDPGAVRRNAYYRMFGMDLLHGSDDGRPYPYLKAQAANRQFVTVFEEFLREVWRGIENFSNTSGPNSTDDAAIAELAHALHDMLAARRRGGNLAREELWAVAMMSWLELTLAFNTPIVADIGAEAESPSERLRKAGERVGLAYHQRAEAYLELATPLSTVLRDIEAGTYDAAGQAQALYAPGAPAPGTPPTPRQNMMTIITQWSIVTGRDMKARRVTPTAPTPIVSGGNGRAQRQLLTR